MEESNRMRAVDWLKSNKWSMVEHDTFIEVVPIADSKSHDYGDECWCKPNIEQEGKTLISHNAEDGRQ